MRARFLVTAMAALAGCGGGGRLMLDPSSGGAIGGSDPNRSVTATFHVDVPTGRVSVRPGVGGRSASSRAVFTGAAISFTPSVLLDEAGNTGRKILRVTMLNNRPEAIGAAYGMRVIFSSITNAASLNGNLGSLVNVSTLTGAASGADSDGSLGTAILN